MTGWHLQAVEWLSALTWVFIPALTFPVYRKGQFDADAGV